MSPRVGLGLPVYNGAEYIGQALDALLAQTFRDFEIVICDNASDDDTDAICRAYAERDPRIRYYRNDRNRGVAYNFRRVFELSRGEYFKWAVHDDLCEPTYLERCVEVLDREPSALLCYPKTILIDGRGREIEPFEDRMDLPHARPHERLAHLHRYLRLCHCGLGLIRSEMLRRTRLIDGFESSDVVLLEELAMMGRFREHPEPLYRRRIHDASSFGAYTSAAEYAARMDPANRGRYAMPRTTLFRESFRSIARAPISRRQKWLCAWVLLKDWGPRYWRVLGGEYKRYPAWWWRRHVLRRPEEPGPRSGAAADRGPVRLRSRSGAGRGPLRRRDSPESRATRAG